MSRPAELPDHERGHLDELLAGCAPLAVLAEHVRAFADLLTTRRGADLEDWMAAVEASDLPALHGFVRGLRKDLDAVVAGLSLPYSNGPIEGTNTKFKLLKRQMYGLAAQVGSGAAGVRRPGRRGREHPRDRERWHSTVAQEHGGKHAAAFEPSRPQRSPGIRPCSPARRDAGAGRCGCRWPTAASSRLAGRRRCPNRGHHTVSRYHRLGP